MKLLLSKPRGFCAGVERAIDTVKRALAIWGAPIYVKHEIVHNRHVVESLKEMGAVFIENIRDVPVGSRIVYSAHGIPPSVRDEARRSGLIEIDATCGLVTKVHSAVKRFVSKGYQVILIGHRHHVEMIGTAGEAPDKTTIVETVEEVKKLSFSPSDLLAYLTQTTLSLDDVKDIVDALLQKYPKIETLPSSSICYATTNRQMALRSIIEVSDLVLVIGDSKSSNSTRLMESARKRGVKAFLVNGEHEILSEWLRDVSVIGMTAGASTPESIVQRCIVRLQELGVKTIEEVVYTEENVFFQLPAPVLSAS